MQTNTNIITDKNANSSASAAAVILTARSVFLSSSEIFFSVIPRKNAPRKTVGVIYLKFIVQVNG